MKQVNISLSKSSFIRGLQCRKSLYLLKHHPELRDEISEAQQAIFQSGINVGIYAQKLFPGGVEIPFDKGSLSKQLALTKSEIKKRTKTLYEASFLHDNVFVKVDIVHKDKRGWALYEVKSSTGERDVYLDDVAVQYYVLKGTGLPVSKAFIVHINNKYVRKGKIEIKKLFKILDVTKRVEAKQDFIKGELAKQKKMLKGDIPQIDIGKYCSQPYECDFQGHCWQHIPENSIFDLRGRGVNKFDLYKQGIVHLKNIPLDSLNHHQGIQAHATLKKKILVDKGEIKKFIDSLWYPLYFLDFETFDCAIPPYDGLRPYQKVPFQYSLDYLEKKGGKIGHHEYLAPPNTDPRKEIIARLIKEIPQDACVLAYNMSFEKGVLKQLAEWFPEYMGKTDRIISNIRDLAAPFKSKDYYHYKMNGSFSIKKVLPILVPELSYDDMEICEGGMVSEAYMTMCQSADPSEVEQIRKGLQEYCRLDTLGMVKIVKKLEKVC
ncbi:MAG: DUF2779 domain-containing protein [Thermodesulfovibrionia bacterium]